ncbi:glycosyltransferase family 4 protein [uncultured Friedmanniella sp.]|uniref:glycosyltransferase family 4 protein n=1 Tax=uncultured Friedmanniella sp. TaxID=335381 RepID=UPI0035CA90A2
MRVGLLTQWYDPEPGPAALPGVLARGLAARGHDVQVLTGFPNYPTGRLAAGYRQRRRQDEKLDGIRVRRVALYPSHDRSAVRRILNYGSFAFSATASGLDALRGLDALWVGCSPATVGLPLLAARAGLGLPCVTQVLDLWPDTMLASGFLAGGAAGKLVTGAVGLWCRGLYRASTAVVYISPGVGPVLQARGVPRHKLHYVPLWADEEVFQPSSEDMRAQLGLERDQVVLLYAGAIGEAQGLETLLEAAALVPDRRFVAVLAGSGATEESLREILRRTGGANVRMIGRVPQQQMTALMASADLSYVSLRDHPLSAITMPSKTQAALAAGKPILAAATGDVAQVVRASGAGWVVPPHHAPAIAATISAAVSLGRQGLHEKGERARAFYLQSFSVERGVQQLEALLERAAATRTPGARNRPRS